MSNAYQVASTVHAVTDSSGRRLAVRQGYIICPNCRRKRLLRLLPGTRGSSVALYCKCCHQEVVVDIKGSGRRADC